MHDEQQTPSTDAPSSPTPASDAPAPDNGAADVPQPDPAPAEDDADDASLLGGAGAEAGEGDGGKDGPEAKADGDDDPSKAVPETYELKVTAKDDEGKDIDVPIDAGLLEIATPIFKDVGLTNEQANKLAPLAVEVEKRVIQAQADNYSAMKADWAKATKADKELGGKNWTETESLAAKALDTFGAPKGSEFRKLLDETGLGNHPEMIRMFRRIGEKVGEDSDFIRSDASKQVPVPREAILYPDDVPKEGAK